ncbi:MAG: hypothetical protein HZA49_09510 [Planctomycetes bacterium]|nr:hypothetical protein [Planctomycetota bacterium]
MKKIGLLVAVAFVIAAANLLDANPVVTDQSATGAKQIKISGEMETPMVSRDAGVNSVLDGAPQVGDTLWSPLITLNLEAALGDKITGLIQLQNRRLETGVGTAANMDFFGGTNVEPAVKQALLKLEKFIVQDLTFTYGLQNLKTTLRDGEGAFFLDTGYASTTGPLTEPNGAVWNRAKTNGEFGGLRFDYGSLKNSNLQGLLFTGTVNKNPTGGLHDTTSLTGAVAWFKLGDEKIINALLTQLNNAENGLKVQTIGAGVNYNGAMPNLGAYAEYYNQTGDAAVGVKQSASAYRLGAKYDVQHSLKPYVDLSYWFLSGGGTTKNNNFISLENVKSTMILEDEVFGLDLDSNYTAIKLETGVATKVDLDKDGSPEDLKVKLLFGQFTLSDQPMGMTGVDDSLGTEVDLVVTLQYNPSVSFTLGYATLSSGGFFTDPTTYGAAEDSMKMVSFGANVKF